MRQYSSCFRRGARPMRRRFRSPCSSRSKARSLDCTKTSPRWPGRIIPRTRSSSRRKTPATRRWKSRAASRTIFRTFPSASTPARARDRKIDAAAQERPRAPGRAARGAQPARGRLRHRPHVRSGRLPRRAVATPRALRERRLDGGALPQPSRALGTDAAPHRARGISRRVAAQPRALDHPRHRRALVHAAGQGPAPGRRRRGGSGREGRLRRLGQPPPARVPAAPVRSPADAAQGPGNGGGLAGGVLPEAGELARERVAYRGGRQARAGRGATGRDRAGGDMIARLLHLDELLFRRIGSFRPSSLVRVMRGLTHLGNAESWFAIGFFLLACGGPRAPYRVPLRTGALLAAFTSPDLKRACCRPRPSNKLPGFVAIIDNPDAFSFPTGHAAAPLAGAVALARHGAGPGPLAA